MAQSGAGPGDAAKPHAMERCSPLATGDEQCLRRPANGARAASPDTERPPAMGRRCCAPRPSLAGPALLGRVCTPHDRGAGRKAPRTGSRDDHVVPSAPRTVMAAPPIPPREGCVLAPQHRIYPHRHLPLPLLQDVPVGVRGQHDRAVPEEVVDTLPARRVCASGALTPASVRAV